MFGEKVLGNHIQEFRVNKGWSQTELANRVKVSRNTISSIETGQYGPTAYLAMKLCRELNTTFEELFYFLEDDKYGRE